MSPSAFGSYLLHNALNAAPAIVGAGASIAYVKWLWRRSKTVAEDRRLAGLPARVRFVIAGWRHQAVLRPMRAAPPSSAMGRALEADSAMLDAVTRPYQSTAWDVGTRLRKASAHYETMGGLRAPIWPAAGEQLEVARFDGAQFDGALRGLRLIIDEAPWFKREGPLVLNLFSGDHRLYSIAFALRREDDRLEAYVGAIQGCNLPDTLDMFRRLTRAAHGIRPQDLLIELFRMFCCEIGVGRILLVSDSHRHHRDRYFGSKADGFTTNYDAIWATRGAIRIDDSAFELPLEPRRRAGEAIPPRKRGLYRRRYAMLDVAAAQLRAGVDALWAAAYEPKALSAAR